MTARAGLLIALVTLRGRAADAAEGEVAELDSCAEAQLQLQQYLLRAPPGPLNACHAELDDETHAAVSTTAGCAQWSGQCAANATVSECSVGCARLAGCRLAAAPSPTPLAQPDHPHGEDAAGTPGACEPDPAQCVCPDEMAPLVATMYWSCPEGGELWELSKPRWKATVESWGCGRAAAARLPLGPWGAAALAAWLSLR